MSVALPHVNWPEYRYTPKVGDLVRRPDWRDQFVKVTAVDRQGIRGVWSLTGRGAFFARHPGGRHVPWLQAGMTP